MFVTYDEYSRPSVDTRSAQSEYADAYKRMADRWVTGSCGNEQPVRRQGRWLLYVWNFASAEHGWLDLATDVVEPDSTDWNLNLN